MTATQTADPLAPKFWDKLYQENRDSWTSTLTDEALMKHLDVHTDGKMKLDILVPMCGLSGVLLSLAEKEHCVVGIEWSEVSVVRFFTEHGLTYDKKMYQIGGVNVPVYTAEEKTITLFCADFFLFEQDNLGGFNCVFDHGAVGCVECNEEKKITYAEIISSFVKPGGKVLFSFFDYIHSEHPSIPYAVTEEEVVALYKDSFEPPKLLQEIDAKTAIKYFGTEEGAEPPYLMSGS